MLTTNQILSYAQSGTITKNILTEYYQHELLDSLFRQKGSENYTFIGGTAIRICYFGARFSEDLDFDTTDLSLFDDLMTATIAHMTAKGFVVESRLIHKGAYHCYLKFPSILKTTGISGYSEEKLLIKVDATKVEQLFTQSHLLNKYGVFQSIKVAPKSTILAKKLLTISERKRPKGRDLYDVTYLWGMVEPDVIYLEKIAKTSLNDRLIHLINYMKTLDLPDLARDVAPFLTNPNDQDRVLHFDQFLKSKLATI